MTMLRDNGDLRAWARAVGSLDPQPSSSSSSSSSSLTSLASLASPSAFFFDPEFLCHTWRWVQRKGEKPSSGLVGIVLALHACAQIDVYGFQSSNYFSKDSRPHYYDWERPKRGRERVHPFTQEHKLFASLQRHGYVTLHE